MKKIILISSFMLFALVASAQTIVTTYAQYKSAVLEEFTGIHCTFCPDGHRLAKEMANAFPSRVVLVNVHTGGYAVPGTNEPDFRTPFGSAIAGQTGLTGYPSGTVNRNVFPILNASMALNRGQWRTAGEEIMQERSPLNLGATTTYDNATRTITINVEGYYTQNGNGNYNLINIALLEDSVVGPQTGATRNPGSVLPGGQYRHDHMLRDFITGQWGDTISNVSSTSLYSKTYSYVIPANVNGVAIDPSHCSLAIYVTEGRRDIIQGITLDIDGATNDGNNAPFYGGFVNNNPAVKAGTSGNSTGFTFDYQSATPNAQDFVFELKSNAPSNWNGSYDIGGSTYSGKATVNVGSLSSSMITVNVNPGADAAVAKYTLSVYPTLDTSAVVNMDLNVISGIKELIVNGTGAYGDGLAYNWDTDYLNALGASGSTNYGLTDANVMEEAMSTQALVGVEEIYLNIGWTFPGITDDQAIALKAFMDAGGDVFVAGQDLGWDINAATGNGTAVTRDLFTNYFNASYIGDGSTVNSTLIAESGDAIFGGVGTSTIVDKYAGNMYPDEIDPLSSASSIFYYDAAKSKSAAIRYEDVSYKVVYLGVGLEMIQNANVRDEIVDLSYNWFKGNISTNEFDLLSKGFEIYPNPTAGQFHIEVPVTGDYKIEIFSTAGVVVKQFEGEVNTGKISFDQTDFAAGVYTIQLSYENQVLSKKLTVN